MHTGVISLVALCAYIFVWLLKYFGRTLRASSTIQDTDVREVQELSLLSNDAVVAKAVKISSDVTFCVNINRPILSNIGGQCHLSAALMLLSYPMCPLMNILRQAPTNDRQRRLHRVLRATHGAYHSVTPPTRSAAPRLAVLSPAEETSLADEITHYVDDRNNGGNALLNLLNMIEMLGMGGCLVVTEDGFANETDVISIGKLVRVVTMNGEGHEIALLRCQHAGTPQWFMCDPNAKKIETDRAGLVHRTNDQAIHLESAGMLYTRVTHSATLHIRRHEYQAYYREFYELGSMSVLYAYRFVCRHKSRAGVDHLRRTSVHDLRRARRMHTERRGSFRRAAAVAESVP
jgi:hypothetical protein